MKCKKCEVLCPEIMPVNGPNAWGLDKETFEPICPLASRSRTLSRNLQNWVVYESFAVVYSLRGKLLLRLWIMQLR